MKLSIELNELELSQVNGGLQLSRTKRDLNDAGDVGNETEALDGDVIMGDATALPDPDFGTTPNGRRARRGLSQGQLG